MKKIITLALVSLFFLNSSTFAEMDKDEKRTVTKAEFVKRAEEMFARMDVNKDGKLTPEERKAYWQARKLEHQQKQDLKKEPKKVI
jgi:Ca2+-binding EF-hand superfamily protein